ncbi:efflux RND transporter permease subunit [Mariniblastus sp.]|nr:efflux RND transporter permease subunit [Mariniblastus sp.]
MKSVIRWAIKNSPAMNTLLIVSMLIGAASMVVMRREVFPNFALEIVLVSVPFPGATPEETEVGICQKIESAVSNLDGVKKMTSVGMESFGYVILELNNNVSDVQKVLNDVRSSIDQISTFPPNAEDPEVKQIIFRAPAISLGILAPERSEESTLAQQRELRDIAERVRAELLEQRAVKSSNPFRKMLSFLYQPKGSAISSAEIVAAQPFEISVEVSEDNLRKYGLSLDQIAQIIRQQNSDMPGGTMQTERQKLILRSEKRKELGEEIGKLPIMSNGGNGIPIAVADVAEVIDGFAETSSMHSINGRDALVIRVSKTNEEDLFTIVEAVKAYVAKAENEEAFSAGGYQIKQWGDVSVDVRDRIEMLSANGIMGLIAVFVVLAIFLDLRLAFWVAMGIPASILAAGFILLITGQTLNMLSMFAFLMALGIVVDDAIVIGENIYAKREEGFDFINAAVYGTAEVLPAVCASVGTTIIAFMPLMYVTGVMGKFIEIMPVAVIAMLVISLIESTFILPAHLSHDKNLFMRAMGTVFYVFKPLLKAFEKVNRFSTRAMELTIDYFYEPLLKWSLHHKSIVISTVLTSFMCSVALVLYGLVPYSVMPKMDGRDISATIVFPNGTQEQFAADAVNVLSDTFKEVDADIRTDLAEYGIDVPADYSVNTNIYRRVGEVGNGNLGPMGVTNGSHVGSVEVQLINAELRNFAKLPADKKLTSENINGRWRKKIYEKDQISGYDALKFGMQSMGPGGAAIEFKILSDKKGVPYLDEAIQECKSYLATKQGVKDIEDDSRPGKREVMLSLNELGQNLGLDEAALSSTIRSGYFGAEVMRLQRGRHEVKLMVRYPYEDRKSMSGFEQIRIRDNQGVERPLIEVANIDVQQSASEINRLDQKRSVTVSADVDSTEGNSYEIIAEMQRTMIPVLVEKFRADDKGEISFNWEGEQAQNQESITSMFTGFGIALLCMFVLLTLQFRSYVQPAIILAIIPFGWLGAILGHYVVGINLSLFSFFGLIALTGVVVNDSIVLVDFINRKLRSGVKLEDALLSAGRRRFRPIMLTSMTTIAGLTPIIWETSMQAQVLIPMATSIIFGLLTGTLLILILVPIFYHIYGSMLLKMGFDLYNSEEEFEDSVPTDKKESNAGDSPLDASPTGELSPV